MERLTILAPAAFGVALLVFLLAVYTVQHARGQLRDLGPFKSNEILGPFWGGYMAWLLRPIERVLISARIAPTHITVLSLALCVLAGVAIALDRLASGAWLFILGGVLDILDGRLARAAHRETKAGALFDSIADRWGELALFAGFAWYLRDDGGWLLAVMLVTAGSFMVSYTRARSEALGLELRGGAMQRAERIFVISAGTLVAAWFGASESTAAFAPHVIGIVLAVSGVLSCGTAIGRWHSAHRALQATERTQREKRADAVIGGSAAPTKARRAH